MATGEMTQNTAGVSKSLDTQIKDFFSEISKKKGLLNGIKQILYLVIFSFSIYYSFTLHWAFILVIPIERIMMILKKYRAQVQLEKSIQALHDDKPLNFLDMIKGDVDENLSICSKCGAEVNFGIPFCTTCGASQ